ncbi:uncharacterized protein E6C27_scaffold262G001760 [Cucumis melo var. makuwa]|uniref:Uncharacterized protein n=1 Tax=Cucumis melo var. makuwa TaxID=1194695 RepID=A0A5A7TG22_CUCMM|nr:uncharacterized protein E6C27_scaffold262G001760 [Cucumis melo var. makuwa]
MVATGGYVEVGVKATDCLRSVDWKESTHVSDPSVTVSVLTEMIKQQYGYTVKYRRVWQVKRKALVAVFGDWDKSYNELPYWLSAVVHYNSGTRVDWFFLPSDVPETTIFGRVF